MSPWPPPCDILVRDLPLLAQQRGHTRPKPDHLLFSPWSIIWGPLGRGPLWRPTSLGPTPAPPSPTPPGAVNSWAPAHSSSLSSPEQAPWILNEKTRMVPRGLSSSWVSIPGQALAQECAMAPTAHRSDRSPQALRLEFQALLQAPASLPRMRVHRPDCTHQPCTFPSRLNTSSGPLRFSPPPEVVLSQPVPREAGPGDTGWRDQAKQAGWDLDPGSKACPYCLPLSREPRTGSSRASPGEEAGSCRGLQDSRPWGGPARRQLQVKDPRGEA